QLDPQGTRIQEYRAENPTTQAQLTDIDIAKRIFNTKKRGKRLAKGFYVKVIGQLAIQVQKGLASIIAVQFSFFELSIPI
ncbi:MAG: hypothetical protein EZS28_044601, partial [Streblomastix strix]